MVDDHERAGAMFATHLLRAAVSAPVGTDVPVAGRSVAALLDLLAQEGAGAQLVPFLAPEPGGQATFTVRAYSYGRLDPDRQLPGLDPAGALREVARLAADGADLVEMVAVAPDGLVRRVVERRLGGRLRYLFAEEGTYEGQADSKARALARWRAVTAAGRAADRALVAAARSNGTGPAPAPGAPERPAPPAAAMGPMADLLTDTSPRGTPSVAIEAVDGSRSVESVRQSVREALEEVTVEVDLGAIEAIVADAVTRTIASADPRRFALDLSDVTDRRYGAGGLDEDLVRRLVEALERQPSGVAASASPHPAPALPPGVSAEIDRLLPTSESVAAKVVDELRSVLLLRQTSGSLFDGDGRPVLPDAAEATLLAAAETLELQAQRFDDRVRSGGRALEALADELAARSRNSEEYSDRVAHSLSTTLERVGRRIDAQLEGHTTASDRRTATALATLTARVDALVRALGSNGEPPAQA